MSAKKGVGIAGGEWLGGVAPDVDPSFTPGSTHPVTFGVDHRGPIVYSGNTAFPEKRPESPNTSWFQIYKCGPDGVESRIHEDPLESQAIAALSHDYSKVAYMAKRQYNVVDDPDLTTFPFIESLRVVNIDGSGSRTIDSTWTSIDHYPYTDSPQALVWSPDGTKLAVLNSVSGTWVYGPDDTKYVVSAISGWAPPCWSHDSQYVFYNAYVGGVGGPGIWRRKWDASDSPVEFLVGATYPDNATFHMHPHDPILVFNYTEGSGGGGIGPDPENNRALGFLYVGAPGYSPEFIKWGQLADAGIWHRPFDTIEDTYLSTPQWSPDGRYILAASDENRTITAPHYVTSRYYVFDRDLTFVRSWSMFNDAGTAALLNDTTGTGYKQHYPPTWASFETQAVVGEANGSQPNDYSIKALPDGTLVPFVQTSFPSPLPYPPHGYCWWRQLGSGCWYPSWWGDYESKYY